MRTRRIAWHAFIVSLVVLVVVHDPAESQEVQVFFGNLHSHTSYSDGSATPEVAYAHARDVAGLDFMAITEHNHKKAPSRIATDHELYNGDVSTSLISTANAFTENGSFVALYGQEFSTIGGGNHANVFEVGDVISTNDVPNGEWDKLLNEWLPDHLDSQGEPALLLLNHPAQSRSPNNIEYGIDDYDTFSEWREKLDSHAQLINIVNGPSHDKPNPGKPSESEFLRYLDLGLHVAPTADQDNHRENWGSAAETRTGVIATSLTKSNILNALKARHVYATEDRNLHVIVTVNGALMGTRFQGDDVPSVGSELDIQVELTDEDEPNAIYTIDVFEDHVGGSSRADVVEQVHAEDDGGFAVDGITYTGGDQYLFLRITQTDQDESHEDRVWVAPVWFEPNGEDSPDVGPLLTIEVNELTEEATITNVGDVDVNLRGWKVVSVKGNQVFTFINDIVLETGSSVVVTSGPNAVDDPPDFVRWKKSHMWSNSGDPGQLIDKDGNVVAETE